MKCTDGSEHMIHDGADYVAYDRKYITYETKISIYT